MLHHGVKARGQVILLVIGGDDDADRRWWRLGATGRAGHNCGSCNTMTFFSRTDLHISDEYWASEADTKRAKERISKMVPASFLGSIGPQLAHGIPSMVSRVGGTGRYRHPATKFRAMPSKRPGARVALAPAMARAEYHLERWGVSVAGYAPTPGIPSVARWARPRNTPCKIRPLGRQITPRERVLSYRLHLWVLSLERVTQPGQK